MTPITNHLDSVCLGVNEHREYIRWWPLVVTGWRKYFPEALVHLGFVTNRTETDPLVRRMREYGDVRLFPIVNGIDTINQARIVRHYLAASLHQSTVALHDIDSVILQREYYQSRLTSAVHYGSDLLAIGQEAFRGTRDEGKFSMGYATACGTTWGQLVGRNPHMSWIEFVNAQCGLPGKADIRKEAVSYINCFRGFCDESWLTHKLYGWTGKIHHEKYGKEIAKMTLWQNGDSNITADIVETQHLIPMSAHMEKVNNVMRHLGCPFDPEWCDV